MIKHLGLKAYGKINLGLDVVRRREDGYHEVRMIMQTVGLYDRIDLFRREKPGIGIETNLYYLPNNENNLAVRAARLLMDEFGITEGIDIRIKKLIPVAAGMAGGSADAAALLFGVNKMFSLGLSMEELMKRGVKLGADVPNPKSHVAYGFATHVVVLDDDGRVKEVYAAHDSGKVVNPISIQGQIEGGVLMGLGYALTEDFPLKNGVPQAKYGTLGLMRSTQIPDIHAIYVEKEELLPFAYGAKGIGEIATIPTAPAAQGAYYAKDHVLRTTLPMDDTYYSKKK